MDLIVTDKLGEIILIYPLEGAEDRNAILRNGITVQELPQDGYVIDNSDGRLILKIK